MSSLAAGKATIAAVFAPLCILCAPLLKTEYRARSLTPHLWFLTLLLASWTAEFVAIIVHEIKSLNTITLMTPFAFILILIAHIGKLLQEDDDPAWHSIIGTWSLMFLCDTLSLFSVNLMAPLDLLGSVSLVAPGLRLFFTICSFALFLLHNRVGSIRLGDDADEQPTTSSVNGTPDSHQHSTRSEIRAVGGTWPWIKSFMI